MTAAVLPWCESAAMRALAEKVFYGPPDWVVSHTTARTRRAVNFWIFALWLIPGTIVWFFWLRNALWFVGFMSIFALWWTGWGGFGSETPVEHEET